jgi:hypothetical protein
VQYNAIAADKKHQQQSKNKQQNRVSTLRVRNKAGQRKTTESSHLTPHQQQQ